MRSSLRARTSPSNAQHSNSSSSSLSSARPERSTRSHHKTSPRRKSTSQVSVSDDDGQADGHDNEPQPLTRRSTRQTVDEDAAKGDEEMDGDMGESEDDITRCVCGHQEYPGPPLADELNLPPDSTADDAGGLFIQCDKCHVWQHGGCVGIMDESKSPENYFCELCDRRLHSVTADSRGQRYSKYLPLYPNEPKSARKGSVGKENEAKARKDRENISRASVDSIAAKRRSTMNSRQAYDEEETLRRVIEESKGEDDRVIPLAASRKGKRSRDDSEDSIKHEIKRQRTSSDSPDPPSTLHTASHIAESDDESSATRPTASSLKKARSVAAESQRQRDLTEREKTRELQRAEAAGRRKERAGRRRGDESEALDDTPRPDHSPHVRTSQPLSPPASAPPPAPSSSHKRGGNKKPQKRAGRNQYTKDRDFSAKPVASPHRPKSNPQPQTSSGEEPVNSNHSPNPTNDVQGPAKARLAKAKAKNARQQPAESESTKEQEKDTMTLADMKKRATLMMEYISKAQLELPSDKTPSSRPAVDVAEVRPPDTAVLQDDFKDMTSREMMETLTGQISLWQKQYADVAPAVN